MKTLIAFLTNEFRVLKSLKFRIFILMMLIGIIPCIVLTESIILSYRSRALSVRTTEAMNQSRILANHLEAAGHLTDPANSGYEALKGELDQLSSIYDGRILVIDSDFIIVSDTYGISVGKTMISKEIIDCATTGGSTSGYDNSSKFIEFAVPIQNPETGEVTGVMFMSASTDTIRDSVDILRRKAWIIIVVTGIFIFFIAASISTLLVRPFNRVTKAITEAQEGFDTERVSIPDYTETEAIMNAFNQLMTQMKTLDESRQEFVANVSHELKTPLASMKVLADSIRGDESVPVETYREFMDDIVEEVDRENKIVTDLLSLVKMDKNAGAPNIETTDVNAMIEQILKRLQPLALKNNVEIVFESQRAVIADIDQTKLSLAISNLAENAVKYNKPGGWVRVRLDADHQFFTLIVSDSGIGVPEDQLDHIFERFYRADKSHSKEIGGTGLGLSITRSAILLHRGAIRVNSVEGQGTTFTMRVPLKYML